MINFDAMEFNECQSEEVLSLFWPSVYIKLCLCIYCYSYSQERKITLDRDEWFTGGGGGGGRVSLSDVLPHICRGVVVVVRTTLSNIDQRSWRHLAPITPSQLASHSHDSWHLQPANGSCPECKTGRWKYVNDTTRLRRNVYTLTHVCKCVQRHVSGLNVQEEQSSFVQSIMIMKNFIETSIMAYEVRMQWFKIYSVYVCFNLLTLFSKYSRCALLTFLFQEENIPTCAKSGLPVWSNNLDPLEAIYIYRLHLFQLSQEVHESL